MRRTLQRAGLTVYTAVLSNSCVHDEKNFFFPLSSIFENYNLNKIHDVHVPPSTLHAIYLRDDGRERMSTNFERMSKVMVIIIIKKNIIFCFLFCQETNSIVGISEKKNNGPVQYIDSSNRAILNRVI